MTKSIYPKGICGNYKTFTSIGRCHVNIFNKKFLVNDATICAGHCSKSEELVNLGRMTLPFAFIFIGLYCYQLFITKGSLLKSDFFKQCNCILHINKLVWITQLIQEECLCWISTDSFVKINTLCFNTSLHFLTELQEMIQRFQSENHVIQCKFIQWPFMFDGIIIKLSKYNWHWWYHGQNTVFLRWSNFRFFFCDIFQIANNSIRSNCILYHFYKKLF